METKKHRWWIPVSWQGWTLIVIFVLLSIVLYTVLRANTESMSAALIGFVLLDSVLFTIIFYVMYKIGKIQLNATGDPDSPIKADKTVRSKPTSPPVK